MTKTKSGRPSFSLRLQPYDGSLLAEVVHYLNSLDRAEANRRVENVLVMALLAQARLYDQGCSEEERRRCCIEACDALEKHASALRQLVGVDAPLPVHPIRQTYEAVGTERKGVDSLVSAQVEDNDDDKVEDAAEVRSPPKARIESQASPAEVNSLFGD